MQGVGVSTPIAAMVADAVVGFARLEHMPNGMTFTIGTWSMMFAANWLATFRDWSATPRGRWRRTETALKLRPVHHLHGHYSVSLAECDRRLYPAEYHVTASQPAAVLRCPLAETDPELAAALDGELVRQQDGIELIARENAVSARSSWRRKDRC